jgi:hypothetical protein
LIPSFPEDGKTKEMPTRTITTFDSTSSAMTTKRTASKDEAGARCKSTIEELALADGCVSDQRQTAREDYDACLLGVDNACH